jgi:hypothetical protein
MTTTEDPGLAEWLRFMREAEWDDTGEDADPDDAGE